MPIIRKVIDVGASKAVTIPKSWLDYYRDKTGHSIQKVTIEVNNVLQIAPFFPVSEKEAVKTVKE
jgi:hypothetical protein